MILNIFDKIKNVQYIVECCNKAFIPDYKQMKKIYLYARSRIVENISVSKKLILYFLYFILIIFMLYIYYYILILEK